MLGYDRAKQCERYLSRKARKKREVKMEKKIASIIRDIREALAEFDGDDSAAFEMAESVLESELEVKTFLEKRGFDPVGYIASRV